MSRIKIAALCLAILLPACTLNFSVFPSKKPLKEQVIEGEGKAKILLLDLSGIISMRGETGLLGKISGSQLVYIAESLKRAEKDKDIKALVIRINSPGGTVAASDFIYHEIIRFKAKKKVPVIAYITELGASGGYYAAMAADEIAASPAAVTGSIGVIAVKFNLQGLMQKVGVADETFKSGEMKDFLSPFRPTTPEEKKMFQSVINDLFARFLSVAYENRKKLISKEELQGLANGRVFTSSQALQAKLIDRVSYLDEEIERIKKTLSLKEARVVTYGRGGTAKSTIYSGPGEETGDFKLISIDAGDFLLPAAAAMRPFSGVQFMYVWMP
jgi:protease-4